MDTVQTIPQTLVYETIDGRPIYYRHYRDYLNGTHSTEEFVESSYLQSDIVSLLFYALMHALSEEYKVLTNELGLQLKEKTTRAADIAIISKAKLKGIKDRKKYVSVPPDVVIEVDIKADLTGQTAFSYISTKTEDLFAFGVDKVLWVLSDAEKVIVAVPGTNWEIIPWAQDIKVVGDFAVNVDRILSES